MDASLSPPFDELPDGEAPDLEDITPEALGSLLVIELRQLRPLFGIMPDLMVGPKLETADLWLRLYQMMETPVQVLAWRGDKRVLHVLRQWVLVVWANGRITPLEWHIKGCGQIELRPARAERLDLCHMATGNDWLLRHKDATRWEFVHDHVVRGGAQTAAEPRARNSKAFNILRSWVLTYVDSTRLDERIRDALSLDARVLESCRSWEGLQKPDSTTAAVSTYNWVAQHLPAMDMVEVEAPQLIDWFVSFAQRWAFPCDGEPLHWLKGCLREHGIGRKGWLLVLGHGRELMQHARAHSKRAMPEAALALLKTHTVTGAGEPIPAPLFELLCHYLDEPGWGWNDPGGVLAYLVEQWRLKPPTTAQAQNEWHAVLEWLASVGIPPRLNAQQRQQGVAGLIRRARRWQFDEERKRRAVLIENLRPLPVWHEPIAASVWHLYFLRTRREMMEEGDEMSHCLGHNGPKPTRDRLFARVSLGSMHIGTAMFEQVDGVWRLSSVRGRHNEDFDQFRHDVVKRLAAHIVRPVYADRGIP